MLNWETVGGTHDLNKCDAMLKAMEYAIEELRITGEHAQARIDKMDQKSLDNYNITLLGDAYRDVQYITKMLISMSETLEEYVNCRSDTDV